MKTSKITEKRYLLPENLTKKLLLDTFKSEFVVKEIVNNSEEFSILESFEWGLYQNQLLAIRHENQSISVYNESELLDPDSAMTINDITAKDKYWWHFPDSSTRDLLKKILDLRALYSVFDGIMKIEQYNFQNEDEKILVFCQVISIFEPSKPRTPIIRQAILSPVTGYDDEFKQASSMLEDLGGFTPSLTPLNSLFGAIGLKPQPYTVKPELKFAPTLPSRQTASIIISTMIEKQRLTEEGIIKDIDTEFLHHFRVSLRMIRAALVQLKETFPEQDLVEFKERFGNLARETNHLRDIDVFILDKERYLGLLPDTLREGLMPMFNDFEKQRVTEAKRISKWIASKAYINEITDLQNRFADGYSAVETLWSEQPVIDLAVNKIQNRYKKIYKAASKINHDTPDEAIHALRIECKKLRYLLYFFGNLFSDKKVKVVAKHLKSLQDKLGIFNDLTIQGEFLGNYLNDIEHKPKKDILLIASLGGLISSLHTMQVQQRDKCIDALAEFSNKENRQLFKETFVSSQVAKEQN